MLTDLTQPQASDMVGERQPVLAVDVMGSDLGSGEILDGVCLALKSQDQCSLRTILVGDGKVIESALSQRRFRSVRSSIEVLHADDVIAMDESPTKALRHKKNSSMAMAVELVRDGKANGALSCGNTGALVAFGTIRLRTIDGLERPALATVIPAIDRNFILLDVGANPEPTARQLVHGAILGAHYGNVALKMPSPTVGLLSIGTEEGKGTELVQDAHAMLKLLSDNNVINYVGLIEGFQLFQERAASIDVVLCDGFVGNVLIKTMESIAARLSAFLRKELLRNPLRAFGCLFIGGALRSLREKLSAERYGGAPLLGLNGSLFKAHGSSNRKQICHAILIAQRFLRASAVGELRRSVALADEILRGTNGADQS
ncbi:MAG: phosphate acyltransferase PlsX [Puniceicoccales bacterium]|jgi:glycerol-3-phosphate acyltransferase PlsX|nr:phosphate acyltransferase PlsX [Puniceicoccales bacterium]